MEHASELSLFDEADLTAQTGDGGRTTRVLAVDAMALLYRAYYAVPDLTDRSGRPTGGLYGFLSMTIDLLIEQRPTHAIVAFESRVPTFRHERFSGYKSGRRQTPEPLVAQFAPCMELARLMGLAVVQQDGLEADDLLAAVARTASGDREVLMASGDRDLYQLLGPNVAVVAPGRPGTRGFTRIDTAAFRQRYGIEPSQWIEERALEGDASDSLPGVAGIGEKTALDLVRRFGTLEGIYAALDALAPGVRKRLEAGHESAFMTRELLRLAPGDIQIAPDLGVLTLHDDQPLREQLSGYDIRSLDQRWARYRAHLRGR